MLFWHLDSSFPDNYELKLYSFSSLANNDEWLLLLLIRPRNLSEYFSFSYSKVPNQPSCIMLQVQMELATLMYHYWTLSLHHLSKQYACCQCQLRILRYACILKRPLFMENWKSYMNRSIFLGLIGHNVYLVESWIYCSFYKDVFYNYF